MIKRQMAGIKRTREGKRGLRLTGGGIVLMHVPNGGGGSATFIMKKHT